MVNESTAAIIDFGGFLGVTAVLSSVACPSAFSGFTAAVREPCLKGTVGYAPALLALVVTGSLLRRRHPAGRQLLAASAIFLCAMLLRWLDRDLCQATRLFGAVRGTHALWHLLNAVTIYLLLVAALEAVQRPVER